MQATPQHSKRGDGRKPACRYTEEDVFNYSEDLAELIENPEMETHLAECPVCKAVLDDILQVAGAAKQLQSPANKPRVNSAARAGQAIPETISGFKLRGVIGEGGMGKVFKAYDPTLDRLLALKVMKDELSDNTKFCERFIFEAKILAKLNHPNVVSVHNVGRHERLLFIAMEFVEGQPLSEKIRIRKLGIDSAIEMFTQVLEGVNAAHENNIIHRDIKPGNIMVSNSGMIKILDFGLAKEVFIDSTNTSTAQGAVLGTLAYLAPEIAMGKKASIQSDVYALGLVFYQMLTNRIPFTDTAEPLLLIERIKTEDLIPPSDLNSNVPPGIDRLILKMCAKKQEDRHRSVADVLKELSLVVSDEQPAKSKARSKGPSQKPSGRTSGRQGKTIPGFAYCGNCGARVAAAELSRNNEGTGYCAKCATLFESSTTELSLVKIPSKRDLEDPASTIAAPALIDKGDIQFYFCESCGKRITSRQIDEGEGRDKKLKGVYCKDCAVGVMTVEFAGTRPPAGKTPETPSVPVSKLAMAGARDSNVKLVAGSATARIPTLSSKRARRVEGSLATPVLGGAIAMAALAAIAAFALSSQDKGTSIPQTPAPKNSVVSAAKTPEFSTPVAQKSGPVTVETVSPPAVMEPVQTVPIPSSPALPPLSIRPEPDVAATSKTPEVVPIQQLPSPPERPIAPPPPVTLVASPEALKQLAIIRKQVAALLQKKQFSDAESLLAKKLQEPDFKDIADRLKKELSDLEEVKDVRQRAVDILRAKVGSSVTLKVRGSQLSGIVKSDSNPSNLYLTIRDGPEMSIRADQLDCNDVDRIVPLETGDALGRDLRRRGLLFLAAGESAKAEEFLIRARDAGFASSVAPYLEHLAAEKDSQREIAAAEAFKKAEALFNSKNWKGAKQAYEAFQRDYATSAMLATNAETIKKRFESIDDARGPAKELSLDLGGGVTLELMLIPAGEFAMGAGDTWTLTSGVGNSPTFVDERPVHNVKISKHFYMGKYLVTQAQFDRVLHINPSNFKGDTLPVENISFVEAEKFCKKLSELTGKNVCLPSEAQWEYSCRAGTKTIFYTGDNDAALERAGWFCMNSDEKTHPVGQKLPNAWGLYDMHGNVQEWCADWYAPDYYAKSPAQDPHGPEQGTEHVLRGGSYHGIDAHSRSASRFHCQPNGRSEFWGMRVIVSPAGS
jgi:serine/threonine protein kinase/formylglycine-generating enzyme required for sulfatase activity